MHITRDVTIRQITVHDDEGPLSLDARLFAEQTLEREGEGPYWRYTRWEHLNNNKIVVEFERN